MGRIFFLCFLAGIFVQLQAQSSMEYTDAEAAAFVADLEAGTYDTLVLTTSGGIYDIYNPSISRTMVIMGKEGLESKPVLKNTGNRLSAFGILRIEGSAVRDTVTFMNLEFDGSGALSDPLIIRSDDDSHLVFRNCYIHNALNSDGAIRMNSAGTSIDMQNTLTANSTGRIIHPYLPGALYGDILVKNCTFSGITEGDVIYFSSSLSGTFAAGNNISIDHCTFYNIGGNVTRYERESIHGVVSITNSIFEQVTGGLSPMDIIDYNYLAGMGYIPGTATNSIEAAPVFADAAGMNIALVNNDDLTGGDLQILGDLSWYDETNPPKVLAELIRIDDTHVMVQFNEFVDRNTAANTVNYVLSGSGGVTGNPSAAIIESNGTDVTLTVSDLSGLSGGQTVVVTVSGVEDLSGNVISEDNVATYTLVDETPPVIAMAAQALNNGPGVNAVARSNEKGMIYLVRSDVTQATIEDFENAIESGLGTSAQVTTANADVNISVEGLKVGQYYAYAVDASDNISGKSENGVTVSDNTAPDIGMPAKVLDNSGLETVSAATNEPGTIYLILEGEAQATVADFEAAVAADKGSSVLANADDSVSIDVSGLVPGIYYGYAVDEAGNISAKSSNAITITMFEPRIRYYAAEDSPQLTSDLRSALHGDVFVLTSGGEEYLLDNWMNIEAKIKIMADVDLEERPILTTYKESNTVQTLRLYADGCAIHAVGIEFDSKSRAPGEFPPKYAIRTNPDIGNYSLVLEDCYFHGTWQANDGSSGAIIKLYQGTYADSIIFRNCIFEGDQGIVLNSTGDFGWDKFEITNCTFMDIPDDQAIEIRQIGDRKNLPVLIDHCTFYNVGGVDEEVILIDSLNNATVRNTIFGSTASDKGFRLYGDPANQALADYLNNFESPLPLADEGGILGTNLWSYDPVFADPGNGNLTLGNALLLNLGSDGLPLGDLRWADIFGPKVNPLLTARSDSTLLLRFDEWIDTTTAETITNYTLSGSAGFSGNVTKAELYNFHAVLLTLESFAAQAGNEIIVTVNNVLDTLGNTLDPMHNTASYVVEEFRPVVTAEPQTLTNALDQKVIASSNQGAGFVWVILDGEPQSILAELEAAVSAKKGAHAAVTEAYTDVEIDVFGIEPGTYYAYATDAGGNVSEKGVHVIQITDGIPPTVTYAIQSVENGDDDIVFAQSNEHGTIYIVLDGEKDETANELYSAKVAKKGASAIVTSVDTDIEISTRDLVPGIYYGYAVDEAGNVSAKGANPMNIKQSTTGIEEPGMLSAKVYSSKQIIIIEAGDTDPDRAVIYDLTGSAVLDRKIESGRSEFAVDQQGIYFVELISNMNRFGLYKVIVW